MLIVSISRMLTRLCRRLKTTLNLVKMSYTKNELALLDLIGNVNNIFYYVGEEGDLIDRFDLKQLDKAVASFKNSIQLGDHNAQD